MGTLLAVKSRLCTLNGVTTRIGALQIGADIAAVLAAKSSAVPIPNNNIERFIKISPSLKKSEAFALEPYEMRSRAGSNVR